MENELDEQDITPEEEQDLNLEEESDDTTDEADERARKAEEVANNQKIRAEKAESELKALKAKQTETVTPTTTEENPTPTNGVMGLKDIRALQDVPDEDVDEVIEYAKFKGVPVAEAKTDPVVQNILSTRKEERASAEAANTKQTRRTNSKTSEEALLNAHATGNLKEEDMEAAARARIKQKMNGT